MSDPQPPEVAKLLPPAARELLVRASRTPGTPFQRQVAIDDAVQRVRLRWPEYFRPECFGEVPDPFTKPPAQPAFGATPGAVLAE